MVMLQTCTATLLRELRLHAVVAVRGRRYGKPLPDVAAKRQDQVHRSAPRAARVSYKPAHRALEPRACELNSS